MFEVTALSHPGLVERSVCFRNFNRLYNVSALFESVKSRSIICYSVRKEHQSIGANVCGAGCQVWQSLFGGERISCSYRSVDHQSVGLSFTNRRRSPRLFSCLTRALTALPRHRNSHNYNLWFDSAIVPVISVQDPILLVASGNFVSRWPRHYDLPKEVIASFLRGRKIWVLASKGSRKAALLSNVEEATDFENFLKESNIMVQKLNRLCASSSRNCLRSCSCWPSGFIWELDCCFVSDHSSSSRFGRKIGNQVLECDEVYHETYPWGIAGKM